MRGQTICAGDAFARHLHEFQKRFDPWLAGFLEERRTSAVCRDSALDALLTVLSEFSVRAGKRLRPFLVMAGYAAGGGPPERDPMHVAAAAEMLHVFALAHDDIMDQSEVRRGLPTVHRIWQLRHYEQSLRGSAEHFGVSMALLVGDLALALSDVLIDSAPLDAVRLARVRDIWNTMREEVIEGQFLDMLASSRRAPAPREEIWSILSLKSGKYTLERPLHLGAAAAGADAAVLDAFTHFGIPLGRAFQIRDDILGMFGDPKQTGKPVDSDIKEGKSTLLMSRAYESATDRDREFLSRVWGSATASDAEVARVREIIAATGARDYAGRQVAALVREAVGALKRAPIPHESRKLLTGLSDFLLSRQA